MEVGTTHHRDGGHSKSPDYPDILLVVPEDPGQSLVYVGVQSEFACHFAKRRLKETQEQNKDTDYYDILHLRGFFARCYVIEHTVEY